MNYSPISISNSFTVLFCTDIICFAVATRTLFTLLFREVSLCVMRIPSPWLKLVRPDLPSRHHNLCLQVPFESKFTGSHRNYKNNYKNFSTFLIRQDCVFTVVLLTASSACEISHRKLWRHTSNAVIRNDIAANFGKPRSARLYPLISIRQFEISLSNFVKVINSFLTT